MKSTVHNYKIIQIVFVFISSKKFRHLLYTRLRTISFFLLDLVKSAMFYKIEILLT